METVEQLEYLSLVSKICTELDNHFGLNDKDLAEFIINLAESHPTFASFKKALGESGADFSDSFIANLLRLIQKMMPKKNVLKTGTTTEPDNDKTVDDDKELKRQLFPGLCIPDDPGVRVSF